MPTSVTGTSNKGGMKAACREPDHCTATRAAVFSPSPAVVRRGFTLIELLVVLVIIGVLVSLATLAVGNDGARLVQEEAQRMAGLIQLAGEEATLQGRELGLQLTRTGYRFMFLARQEDGTLQWLALERDGVLRPRTFHPAITPELLLEGLPQTLPTAASEHGAPQLFLLSSGERTPFRLRLMTDDGRIVRELEGGLLGWIRVD